MTEGAWSVPTAGAAPAAPATSDESAVTGCGFVTVQAAAVGG